MLFKPQNLIRRPVWLGHPSEAEALRAVFVALILLGPVFAPREGGWGRSRCVRGRDDTTGLLCCGASDAEPASACFGRTQQAREGGAAQHGARTAVRRGREAPLVVLAAFDTPVALLLPLRLAMSSCSARARRLHCV